MTPFKIITLDELKLDKDQPVFADTETCGFYQKIRLVQLYQEGMDEVLIIENPEPLVLFMALNEHHTVWHNVHYDISTFQQQTSSNLQFKNFDCTLLLGRLAFPSKEKFSLDNILVYTLGHDPYLAQNLDKKELQKSNWSVPFLTKEQYLYAATDVYHMPAVWKKCKPYLDNMSYKLDKSALVTCLDFQWNGFPVDEDRLNTRFADNINKIKEIEPPINANSWKQVQEYLDTTGSTDDLHLAIMISDGNDRANSVRQTRKLKKENSFLRKFDTLDGRIYGKFSPSARSGRFTCKDQNLQQLPRKTKGVFGVKPDSGLVMIYADYAQIELRSICAITKCSRMEQLFRDGVDLHGYTAKMVFGPDWTKAHRQLSKTYNFNLLYGGGAKMLHDMILKDTGISIPIAQLERDKRKWQNLWPEIHRWQQQGIQMWTAKRMKQTPLGRKYQGKMMTDHLNIANQGHAADVFKLALHYVYPHLRDTEGVTLCNVIHDSFLITAPEDNYKDTAIKLAEAMQEAWFEMSKLTKVTDLPMPVDVKVGHNWGDIEDDDIEGIWNYSLEPYKMLEKVQSA